VLATFVNWRFSFQELIKIWRHIFYRPVLPVNHVVLKTMKIFKLNPPEKESLKKFENSNFNRPIGRNLLKLVEALGKSMRENRVGFIRHGLIFEENRAS